MELTPEKLLCKIAKILENFKVPYAVTGGFAAIIWGKPRFTADIDIVIELAAFKIPELVSSLGKVDKNVYVSEEAVKDAVERGGEFNLIHSQTGFKIDFWVKGEDVYDRLEIKRALPRKINSQKIYFISPEDLILSKLIWYKKSGSQKHLEDVRSVLANPGLRLDLKYIKKWASKFSVLPILSEISGSQNEEISVTK